MELSSALVVAIVLVSVALYAIMKLFTKPPPPPVYVKPKKADPVYLTRQQLRAFDGVPDKPVYVAIRGRIFDVSRRREVYGKGGAYNCFAGIDAARGLAKYSLDPIVSDAEDDLSDLTLAEKDMLRQWECDFEMKYDVVGELVKTEEEAQARRQQFLQKKNAPTSDAATEAQ